MTPPLPTAPLGGATKTHAPASDEATLAPAPGLKGPVAGAPLAPGDAYVPMDDSATGDYKTVPDLLHAIGDRQLFGDLGYAKYDPERNKKYLDVTLALLEIRKFLRGDANGAAEAAARVEKWLSQPELLSDTLVAHPARVQLIKALKRAPKGQGLDDGVKSILAALSKNYSAKSPPAQPEPPKTGAPKAEEKPKTESPASAPAPLAEALGDVKLFGEKFSAYDKERNKKYLNITLALLEVRKFAKGGSASADAVAKIAAWLGDAGLLVDPVAHQARLGLIRALGAAPKGGDAFDQGVKELLAALKADYSKAGASPKKEASPPSSDIKAKAGPKGLTEVTVNPKSALKEKRVDDAKSFGDGLQSALKPALGRLLKKYDSVKVKCQMTVSIDDATGQVVSVSFKDIDTGANISSQDAKELFEAIANNVRSRFRFKKMGEAGLAIIKVPLSIVGQ